MIFYYWLIFGILFLFLELLNPGLFFFFSFFVGSLAAAVTSYADVSLYGQILSFFIGSVISCIVFGWIFKKNIFGIMPKHGYKTNIYALQGKKAEVIKKIEPLQTGFIKLNGEMWSAKSNEVCPAGSVVEVVDVIGCHCFVRLVNENT